MKNILLVFIAIISLTACEKRKDINGDLKNRREILVTRYWRVKNIRDNGKYTAIKSCEQDNYYVFLRNGEGRWEESLINCFDTATTPPPIDSTNNGGDTTVNSNVIGQPAPATYTSFSWSMVSDLRYIYFKNFGAEGYDPEWEIENMDYGSLSVRRQETIDGYNHIYQIELTAL